MRLLLLTVPTLFLSSLYAATGGPDTGGAVYADSTGSDGPSYAWLDASDGEAHALGDDDTVSVTLPFDFTFYGTAYTSATIGSNGALFFEGATASGTPICPGDSTSWTGIAAYWDDLAASTVRTKTFGVYPWRTFVVSWESVAHATAGGEGRFQIWLLEGRSEAVVVLDDTTWGNATYDDGATATIGVNAASGGLPWSCRSTISSAAIWFGAEDDRPDRAEVLTGEVDTVWLGQQDFDYAGRTLAVGDVNGDGSDDLLVGTQDHGAGLVSLIYRPNDGGNLGDADASFTGRVSADAYGTALVFADLDGDGKDEFAVGAPGNDDAATRAGAVYLWSGGGWSGTEAASSASATWTGRAATSGAGSALAAGDVDGDGYTDLAVGAPTDDAGGTDAGAVYLIHGSGSLPTGSASLPDLGASFYGVAASDRLGSKVAIGDLDGDGAAELLASALFADDGGVDAGTVYVIPGASWAGTQTVDTVSTCALSPSATSARFGTSLLLADFDGSGLLDLAVGASTADQTYSDAGTATVFYDLAGSCPAIASPDATIVGARASANLGASLAAGDLDGDGVADLLVGAPNMTYSGASGGAVYAFTDAPTGTVSASTADHVLGGEASAGALGTALGTARNATGPDSVVATAPYESVAYSSEGVTYAWTWRPDFLDADGDAFVSAQSGGNDCDDAEPLAFPGGTDTPADSIDGDCDGWTDGTVRVRIDDDGFSWDLADVGGSSTTLYDFESYAAGDSISTYGDLSFTGSLTAETRAYGAAPVGSLGARLLPDAAENALQIDFAYGVDAVAFRTLDPEGSYTLTATNADGDTVVEYTATLSGDDRTGGIYRGFTFVEEVRSVVLAGELTDGFGIDALEVAWAVDSDRDLDGYTDAEGDCDDADATVNPDMTEVLGNGVDDDCDGMIDAGNADAYTDASSWAAAASIASSTTVDFEDLSSGEAVQAQYRSLGLLFDGAPTARADIDGTAPHDTLAAAIGSSTTLTFDEDQLAVSFYVLDADGAITVEAYDDGVSLYATTFTPSAADAFYGLVFDTSIDALVITGGETFGLDDVVYTALGQTDDDGDGQTEADGDCDDHDASAYVGAAEAWYDGTDSDCDGGDDYDADRDGSSYLLDCDEADATVNPGAAETYYDGVDQNCDALSDYDADADGHDDLSWGGDDCDDGDAGVNPDATEVYYDDVDADCAGDDDNDADGDGSGIAGSLGGSDCDDTDPDIGPGMPETWYDGIDSDCSGEGTSDYDADGDGYDAVAWGGDDCDDDEPTAYPGGVGEVCYDGIDTDCDGADDYDCDADGYASDAWGGDDCDDTTVDIHPGVSDPRGDGIDADCDGGPEFDIDGDGYDAIADGGRDCDDDDPTLHPGATDACYDGIDSDCDGADDYDCDQDGHASDGYGGDDCDDAEGTTFPGSATETCYDGVDSDCDGADDYDCDQDGHASDGYGGDDCDDAEGTTFPGSASEACYDGVDSDCDGADDYDCDGDGHTSGDFGGDDCDDAEGSTFPGSASEACYDGVDSDCDGADDYDCDGDGHTSGDFGGDDCDDALAATFPGSATEACYDGVDSDCDGADDFDCDQDGHASDAYGGDDCDDASSGVFPGGVGEACYDGVDTDCDGADDYDCDGDGHPSSDFGGDDCDDTTADIHPGVSDPMGDGVDADCDGGPEFDFDGDGYDAEARGGGDCDDTDPSRNPGVTDACYDGFDADCDGADDYDCDQDGHASDAYGGDDCDDGVGGINPGVVDYPYDGIDSDCDGADDFDLDGDGVQTDYYGGADCDDTRADVYPGALDSCYDGVDSDCGREDDDDCDGDGYAAEGAGGTDCDDADASVSPAGVEILADGIDQDCDGADATTCTDCDADGYAYDTDCDDTDAAVNPDAVEVWYDGVDQDCDGANDYDADGDGAIAIAWGGGDCDDADAAANPSVARDDCGGGDEDCDGTVDEDCDDGGDTGPGPDDTGHDTDIPPDETRDTDVDWRPDPEELTAPSFEAQEGCGCTTPVGPSGSSGAAVLVVGALAAARRRARR